MSEGLSKMLKRLPLFEELHLQCPCNFKKAIEIAGCCCPQLKSLELINKSYIIPIMACDEDALAIAENMPGLRHLRLYGPNKMTSEGLLAIIEKCPHFESLDVCHSVPNLGPNLVRKLSQQIKDLRLSCDPSTHIDYDSDYLHFLNANSLNRLSDIFINTDDDSSGLS